MSEGSLDSQSVSRPFVSIETDLALLDVCPGRDEFALDRFDPGRQNGDLGLLVSGSLLRAGKGQRKRAVSARSVAKLVRKENRRNRRPHLCLRRSSERVTCIWSVSIRERASVSATLSSDIFLRSTSSVAPDCFTAASASCLACSARPAAVVACCASRRASLSLSDPRVSPGSEAEEDENKSQTHCSARASRPPFSSPSATCVATSRDSITASC